MTGFFPSSRVQQEKPSDGLVAKCGSCGLFKKCNSPKMVVQGKGRMGVLLVGESPSKEEDAAGHLFTGPAGAFLKDALRQLDVKPGRDVWTTNALICHSSVAPTEKEISYCHPNLIRNIKELEPRVIIPLGRAALVSVLKGYWDDIGMMERWTGWKIPLAGHWVCPTFHPSFLIKMENTLMERLFFDDLAEAFAIDTPPPPQVNYNERIEVLYDDRLVCKVLEEMDRIGGWAAIDYETNCLKAELPKAKIYSCSVSTRDRTISYLWTPQAAVATEKFFSSKRTRKIASNLKFEERWSLKHMGHGVENWGWDTMLAAHVLDNRQSICSIKFQALVKLGVPSYNSHIAPYSNSNGDSPYNRIHEIDVGNLLFYGGMDAILEYDVAMIQRKELGFED